MRNSILLLLMMVAVSCVAQRRNAKREYKEDLAHLRPEIEMPVAQEVVRVQHPEKPPKVEPLYTVNDTVNTILDSISVVLKMQRFLEGYKLQLYSGQNRMKAVRIKKRFEEAFPDMKAIVQYVQPKFRVIAGGYYTNLEAQQDLIRVKQVISTTMLVPSKVPIR